MEFPFNTCETRVFDIRAYLQKSIFTEPRDPSCFHTVRLAVSSIASPNQQDIGLESPHFESRPLKSLAVLEY